MLLCNTKHTSCLQYESLRVRGRAAFALRKSLAVSGELFSTNHYKQLNSGKIFFTFSLEEKKSSEMGAGLVRFAFLSETKIGREK